MAESVNIVDRMTARELNARLRQGDRIAVLDVRRRDAWTADPGLIPGAIWLPLEEVPQRVLDLPQDIQIVLYCS
jgi:rhodanese-related sulfurtransferase